MDRPWKSVAEDCRVKIPEKRGVAADISILSLSCNRVSKRFIISFQM
jgi:hypothetical protein